MTTSSIASKSEIYDLHSHTIASDGHLTPSELVDRAVANGVTTLAITDHDTIAGLAAAHDYIKTQALELTLIDGVEISTSWHSFDIHIVGLVVDTQSSIFNTFLQQQKERRQERALRIAKELEKAGIPDPLQGARNIAGEADLTRAHFARYLMSLGKAKSLHKIFSKYLAKGKIGYVKPQWSRIEEAVAAIHAAGGQAVLAHPTRYQLSGKWLKRLIAEFAQAGGDAIEVAMSQQTPDQRSQLAQHATQFNLLASLGSDFHYPSPWLDLGKNLWLPSGCQPVWTNWSTSHHNNK